MNRLRAGLFAFLAPVLLVATVAQAGTIDVTTLTDTVANDEQCSIREAVEASRLASLLLERTSSKARLESYRGTLDAAMLIRLQFPGEYNDLVQMQMMVGEMEGELIAEEPQTPAATTSRNNLLLDVQALKSALGDLPDDKVYLCSATSSPVCAASLYPSPSYPGGVVPGVTQIHELMLRVIDSTQAEVDRIKALTLADGCDDGSGFDTIRIPEGVHVLNSELVLTDRLDLAGDGDTSIIEGSGASRLIRIDGGTVIAIKNLQLRGGDALAGADTCAGEDPAEVGDGGAICVRGSLTATNVLFVDNQARDGGALFVDAFGTVTADKVRFYNNRASRDGGAMAAINGTLKFTNSTFGCEFLPLPAVPGCNAVTNPPNTAVGKGGAIYFNPQTTLNPEVTPYNYQASRGNLSLDSVLFFGNEADAGSAIAVGPGGHFATTSDVDVTATNATFGQNIAINGATIDFNPLASLPPGSAELNLNNITMVDNDGGTGTGGIRTTSSVSVVMNNSLLADNTGGGADPDCDLNAGSQDDTKFHRNYFRDNSACPGLRQENDPLYTNYEMNAFPAAIGDLVSDITDPDLPFYLPIFPDDYTDLSEIRLVARGATTEEPYSCTTKDQRGLDRLSFVDADCDIGAVEYQVGRRADDQLKIQVNQESCLLVSGRGLTDMGVGNDVGDADYVPASLRILAVERAGARAIIASRNNVATYQGLTIPVVPLDAANCSNYADIPASVEEAILFTPANGFQGETNVTYQLDWIAGSTVTSGGTVSGIAHVRTESRGNISSASLGGGSPAWLLLLSLAALRRVNRRWLIPLLSALCLSSPAMAAEHMIYVTSLADPLVVQNAAGDGQCTLREALESARNDTANPTRGDCIDGNEGPDVVEFAYDPATVVTPLLLEVTLNQPLQAYGSVTIRCPVEQYPGLICRIRRDGASPAFTLISSSGSIAVEGMSLEGGDAGSTNNGGAINSYGAVTIKQSYLANNRARVGGAVFLRGPAGNLSFIDSTFANNSSTGSTAEIGGGGVLAMANGTNHRVEISNSTFVGNQSVRQAAVLNIKTTNTVVIVNSTFSGNTSTAGAGAIDLSDARNGALLRNVTVVGNLSGDVGGSQFYAIQAGTGPGQHRLYNSIVASNFDTGTGSADRNCSDVSGSYIYSLFTLYGENPLAPTCPVSVRDQILPAATVYDGSPAGSYLLPLADNGFRYAQTHAPNLALPVAGVILDAGYNLQAVPSDNLVAPLDVVSPLCANVDQRGKSRVAGGRCDIGAFEYNEVTAVADTASNRNRHDRLAISDILNNDITEDGMACVANRFGSQGAGDAYPVAPAYEMTNFPAAPVFPMQAAWAYDDTVNPMVICAMVTFDVTDGEARFLALTPQPTTERPDRKFIVDGDTWDDEIDTTSNMVLSYRDCNSARVPLTSPCATATPVPFFYGDDWADRLMKDTNARVIQYRAGDASGRVSLPGNITISLLNVPPWVLADTVHVSPGQTARINILANDNDYDVGIDPAPLSCTPGNPVCINPFHDNSLMPLLSPTGLNPASIEISGCKDEDDITDIDQDGNTTETYQACQFGDVFVDYATGDLTWIPRNKFNPFSEDVTYQVSDYAFPESSKGSATVHIVVDRPQGNGGGMISDNDLSDALGIDFLGAAGNLFLGVLGLTALRRRRSRMNS